MWCGVIIMRRWSDDKSVSVFHAIVGTKLGVQKAVLGKVKLKLTLYIVFLFWVCKIDLVVYWFLPFLRNVLMGVPVCVFGIGLLPE